MPSDHDHRDSQRLPYVLGVLALVAVSSVSSGSARAEDYFVSETGSDAATGLAGSPWRQPQEAFDHVGPGDTITVEDGTYGALGCDADVAGTVDDPIVLRARNRWGAHIDASSATDGINLVACSYIVIDGFEVSGADRAGIRVGGLEPDGSDARGVVIRNNWSHDNGSSAAGGHDGIFTGFALDLVVENNLVHDSGEHGIYVSNSAERPIIRNNRVYAAGRNCIQINADHGTIPGDDGIISEWLIEGNVLSDCNGSFAINLDGVANGIARNNVIFGAPNSGGITLFGGDGASPSHDNVIVNNTVYNPGCDNAALQIASGANDNVAFNNILICSTAESGIELQSATGFLHDHNIVSSYSGTSAAANETTLTGAAALALFVSATDLHLAASSAARDEGVATFGGASAPTLDAEAHPRPQETGYDLGAYEYGDAPAEDGGVTTWPDAGTGDGGATMDAGVGDDAGGSGDTGGGCSCNVPPYGGSSSGAGGAIGVLAALVARLRRRTR